MERRPQLFVQLGVILLEFLDLGGVKLEGLFVIPFEFGDRNDLPFISLGWRRWGVMFS